MAARLRIQLVFPVPDQLGETPSSATETVALPQSRQTVAPFDYKVSCAFLRYTRAFTLIELLVVIASIAVLASLLLPGLSKAKARR